MPVCPKCTKKYEDGHVFCGNCGVKLVSKTKVEALSGSEKTDSVPFEETNSPGEEKVSICPSCQAEFQQGTAFCGECGHRFSDKLASLRPKIFSAHTLKVPRLTIFSKGEKLSGEGISTRITSWQVRSPLRQKRALITKSQKIGQMISNIDKQKANISEETLKLTLVSYQNQLTNMNERIGEIDQFIKGIRERLGSEVNDLNIKLAPHQKRLNELKILRKAGGVNLTNYLRLKKSPRRNARNLVREINVRKKILALIKSDGAGEKIPVFPGMKWFIAITIIITITAGGYFTYQKAGGLNGIKNASFFQRFSPSSREESITPHSTDATVSHSLSVYDNELEGLQKDQSSVPQLQSGIEEIDTLESLFDNLSRANLSEDIDLFMSCFSPSFPDSEDKRKNTLYKWERYDFRDLSYELSGVTIEGNRAEASISWDVTVADEESGKVSSSKAINTVVLENNGRWMIIEMN